MGQLRSLCPSGIPVLALTATANKLTKEIVTDELEMTDCVYIDVSPNKPNIRYSVVKTPDNDNYSNFKWLIDELEKNGKETERYLIFCRMTRHVSDLFNIFTVCLGQKAYHQYNSKGQNDDRNRLFGMFHSGTDEEIKQTVQKAFSESNGTMRVLFCTSAFGMGMDTKGVNTVIHYGPAYDVDDYIQESGRIGRDPSVKCHALLVLYPKALCGKISEGMRKYCKENGACKRVQILQDLDSNISPSCVKHSCCSVCSLFCRCLCTCEDSCETCDCDKVCFAPDIYTSKAELEIKKTELEVKKMATQRSWKGLRKFRNVSLSQKNSFQRDILHLYHAKSESTGKGLNTYSSLVFTRDTVQDLVFSLSYIHNKEMLACIFPFFGQMDIDKIWDLFCNSLENDNSESSDEDVPQKTLVYENIFPSSSDSDSED